MNYPGSPITQGTKSDIVKIIQYQLYVCGNKAIVIDSDFGHNTFNAVEAFQTANGLTADGVVEQNTWDALFQQAPPADTIAALALQVIVSQLGQEEIPAGSNSGPMVNEYLKAAGAGPGDAWCQSLVYWCYNIAALMNGIRNPVVKTAGVMHCWESAPVSSRITKEAAEADKSLVLPGYQIIFDHGKGLGHTGLVESISGNTIITIERNSNSGGSRNGGEVVRQTTRRTFDDSQLKGFIKY